MKGEPEGKVPLFENMDSASPKLLEFSQRNEAAFPDSKCIWPFYIVPFSKGF